MPAFALVRCKGRNNAGLILPNILSSPLINCRIVRIIVCHCFANSLVNTVFIFAGSIIILIIYSSIKINDVFNRVRKRQFIRPRKVLKICIVSKSDNVDSFSILRHIAIFHRIQHLMGMLIAQQIKLLTNYFKSITVIVAHKIFNILKECYARFLFLKNSHEFKEKFSASFLIIETFSKSGYRERLAREACKHNIKVRNFTTLYFMNISNIDFYRMIEFKSLCRIRIKLVCVYSLECSRCFKPDIDSADSCKK